MFIVKTIINRVFFYIFGGARYARRVGVAVGVNCRIYTRHFGSEPYLIEIGDNVTVTQTVQFVTHDGATSLVHDEKGRRYKYAKIVVGSNVFIGLNAIILPGVYIGDWSIVAAGAVVTKNVLPGTIVAGVPAKEIGLFVNYAENIKKKCATEEDIKKLGGLTADIIKQIAQHS